MMETITMSSKGQIVIPERIRKELKLKEGTKLVLIKKNELLILEKEEKTMKRMEEQDKKEKIGWMIAGEKAFQKIWDNTKDEETWKRYLDET